jgi:hypothetical protein
MDQPSATGSGAPDRSPVSYSAFLQRVFHTAALIVALLPIPVALLGLLPAYRNHTRFLIFYAPLVCLLTLAYLFYVRDALARLMFAHLLDPLPARVGHYPERTRVRWRRGWIRSRSAALTVLPAALLISSAALAVSYSRRLDDSLSIAMETAPDTLAVIENVGELPSAATTPSPSRVTNGPPGQAIGTSRRIALEGTPPSDIPQFVELTALFIGTFLASMIALVLMALREYAKDALGLSERDVVLGRRLAEPE